MIDDEVLQGLVPPLMQKAHEGPEAWEEARAELVREFEARASGGEAYRCCVIAHYIALLTHDAGERLAWNMAALAQAEQADPDRVRSFLPSLNASVGACHFQRGDHGAAREWYERAREHLDALPDTPYGEKVRSGVLSALDALRDPT